MSILQAAQEAAKSSSRIFLDGSAITAVIAAGGLAAREYFKSRRSKRNGNGNGKGPRPGMAPECLKHRDELMRIDTEQKNAKEDIVEMKGDIKELLRRIPAKGE